jgi:hypothetical protein
MLRHSDGMTLTQLWKKFAKYYGIRMFSTAFTTAHQVPGPNLRRCDVRICQVQTWTTTCTSRVPSWLSATAYSAFTAADKCEGSQLKAAMSGSQWTQWTWGHAMVEDAPYGNNRAPTGHACWQGTKDLEMHYVIATKHSANMVILHVVMRD